MNNTPQEGTRGRGKGVQKSTSRRDNPADNERRECGEIQGLHERASGLGRDVDLDLAQRSGSYFPVSNGA